MSDLMLSTSQLPGSASLILANLASEGSYDSLCSLVRAFCTRAQRPTAQELGPLLRVVTTGQPRAASTSAVKRTKTKYAAKKKPGKKDNEDEEDDDHDHSIISASTRINALKCLQLVLDMHGAAPFENLLDSCLWDLATRDCLENMPALEFILKLVTVDFDDACGRKEARSSILYRSMGSTPNFHSFLNGRRHALMPELLRMSTTLGNPRLRRVAQGFVDLFIRLCVSEALQVDRLAGDCASGLRKIDEWSMRRFFYHEALSDQFRALVADAELIALPFIRDLCKECAVATSSLGLPLTTQKVLNVWLALDASLLCDDALGGGSEDELEIFVSLVGFVVEGLWKSAGRERDGPLKEAVKGFATKMRAGRKDKNLRGSSMRADMALVRLEIFAQIHGKKFTAKATPLDEIF